VSELSGSCLTHVPTPSCCERCARLLHSLASQALTTQLMSSPLHTLLLINTWCVDFVPHIALCQPLVCARFPYHQPRATHNGQRHKPSTGTSSTTLSCITSHSVLATVKSSALTAVNWPWIMSTFDYVSLVPPTAVCQSLACTGSPLDPSINR
jgi:hypothetical protein